jgi:hypothetical protein
MRLIRYAVAIAVVVGAVAVVPRLGHGATPASQARPVTTAATVKGEAKDTSHATTGIVKAVSASTLVITRSAKPGNEMRFEVSPFAHREGTVAIGSPVSVRYREDGATHVATAITVQQAKPQAASRTQPGR